MLCIGWILYQCAIDPAVGNSELKMAMRLKAQEAQPALNVVPPQKPNTILQTLSALRFLASAAQPLGVNAIARELGMAPSSCFKILKHLYEEGFAEFDDETKRYSLGSAAVTLARRALDPGNIFALIRPSLVQFALANDVSVGFWRRIDRGRIVLAGFIESTNPMRIHMSVGQRLPLFIGAVGRAFAAELGLTEQEIEQEFTRLRWRSPPSVADYVREVAHYHNHGYTVDVDNFSPGITTVATVLDDPQVGRGYGLSAIGLSGQTSTSDVRRIGTALIGLKAELGNGWLSRG